MAGRKPRRSMTEQIVLDAQQVRALRAIQATDNEICAVLGVDNETLKACVERDEAVSDAYKKGVDEGKSSLRRVMFKAALGGNTTMQIWLSKQHLGMSDKVEQKTFLNHLEMPKDLDEKEE